MTRTFRPQGLFGLLVPHDPVEDKPILGHTWKLQRRQWGTQLYVPVDLAQKEEATNWLHAKLREQATTTSWWEEWNNLYHRSFRSFWEDIAPLPESGPGPKGGPTYWADGGKWLWKTPEDLPFDTPAIFPGLTGEIRSSSVTPSYDTPKWSPKQWLENRLEALGDWIIYDVSYALTSLERKADTFGYWIQDQARRLLN